MVPCALILDNYRECVGVSAALASGHPVPVFAFLEPAAFMHTNKNDYKYNACRRESLKIEKSLPFFLGVGVGRGTSGIHHLSSSCCDATATLPLRAPRCCRTLYALFVFPQLSSMAPSLIAPPSTLHSILREDELQARELSKIGRHFLLRRQLARRGTNPPHTALSLASLATPSSTDEVRERSVQEVARPRGHTRPVQRARPGSARAPPHAGPPRRRPRFRLRRRRSHARAAATAAHNGRGAWPRLRGARAATTCR